MNKFFSIMLCIFLGIYVSGCAHPLHVWEAKRAREIYEKEKYAFDLSNTNITGTLEIHSFPPSQQILISNYYIKIDDFEPLEFFKHSIVSIKLDEGDHSFKIKAKGFGLWRSAKVKIKAGETRVFEYIGPYWIHSAGELRAKNI